MENLVKNPEDSGNVLATLSEILNMDYNTEILAGLVIVHKISNVFHSPLWYSAVHHFVQTNFKDYKIYPDFVYILLHADNFEKALDIAFSDLEWEYKQWKMSQNQNSD